jgi:carbon dioxide concentrating mechanism protein CcmN
MYLPVLPAVSTSEIYISGDVTIDDSAVIAPGVILQAAKGSKIVIGAGACVGMGAILKAYQGTIEVKENAVLGAGVLVIGQSKIESQVCVGTSTTIYNTSLDSGTIIPAGSVLGDPTRSLETFSHNNYTSSPPLSDDREKEKNKTATSNKKESKLKNEVTLTPEIEEEKEILGEETLVTETTEIDAKPEEEWNVKQSRDRGITEDPWQTPPQNINEKPVVGQVYINKLLFTLFPEKQPKDKRS